MPTLQTDRILQFSCVLGANELLIESFDGFEAMSRLFEFHAELLAEAGTTIDPKALIGTKATVSLNLAEMQGTRYFNGLIASFEQCGGDDHYDSYRARLVPSLWQLSLSSNCRVFQNMTVVDIVKSVIGEYGLIIMDRTSATYKTLEYCTQYSESDFHFITRLMEENGIFYWFEHSDQDNKVQLGDSRSAYDDCLLSAAIPFASNSKGAEGSYGACVEGLTVTATMVSGKHSTADYNYRSYVRLDATQKASTSDYGLNAYDQYLYPAGEEGYASEKESKLPGAIQPTFLEARQQASDAASEVFRGNGNARSFASGYTFTLSKHSNDDLNQKYLLTSLTHHCDQVPSYRADGGNEGGYENRFEAVVSDILWRPSITCSKPRIPGPQTAKVVVSSGEEICIDSHGRVNVQFHWDKIRKPETLDNTWVRVAQQWAGNGWGTYFWPRKDDEVIIEFLNGDPDNPIIVGSVYNGVNVPKYALPDHSTRSGIVTRSSKTGGAANANELRFEDKKDSEQIYINAEKDFDLRVEKQSRRYVGDKDSLVVKEGQYEQVGGDRHINIKGAKVEKVAGDVGLDGGMNLAIKTGQDISVNAGMNKAEKVGMNYSMDAGMSVYIKSGMSLVIESGVELCLKVGGSFISLNPAMVSISGPMVMINSGGAAGSGSAGTIKDPPTPTDPDIADDGSKGGAM